MSTSHALASVSPRRRNNQKQSHTQTRQSSNEQRRARRFNGQMFLFHGWTGYCRASRALGFHLASLSKGRQDARRPFPPAQRYMAPRACRQVNTFTV